MSHVPYASAVGSLMYVMVCTRPDIAHVVGVLSRYMSKPRKEHWTTVLTGEIDRPSTGRVEPVRGCLNNPSRLE
jgi:hypothetical protein